MPRTGGPPPGPAPGRAGAGPPEPASPAFLLIGLGRLVRAEVEAALRAHGLSLRHLSALGHLAQDPGLSYSELGRRASVTAQSMQATLRHLEDLGAVDRRSVAGRGRTAELHVSPVGRELLQVGRRIMRDADDRLLAEVPAEQRPALTRTLMTVFATAVRRRTPVDPARSGSVSRSAGRAG